MPERFHKHQLKFTIFKNSKLLLDIDFSEAGSCPGAKGVHCYPALLAILNLPPLLENMLSHLTVEERSNCWLIYPDSSDIIRREHILGL
jgi:hypothetical protein